MHHGTSKELPHCMHIRIIYIIYLYIVLFLLITIIIIYPPIIYCTYLYRLPIVSKRYIKATKKTKHTQHKIGRAHV